MDQVNKVQFQVQNNPKPYLAGTSFQTTATPLYTAWEKNWLCTESKWSIFGVKNAYQL